MIAAQESGDRPVWLGGEAHVPFHLSRSIRSRWLNGHGLALTLAFLAGAALGATAVATWCQRRHTETPDGPQRRILSWRDPKSMAKASLPSP
jgi:hypothetical protein